MGCCQLLCWPCFPTVFIFPSSCLSTPPCASCFLAPCFFPVNGVSLVGARVLSIQSSSPVSAIAADTQASAPTCSSRSSAPVAADIHARASIPSSFLSAFATADVHACAHTFPSFPSVLTGAHAHAPTFSFSLSASAAAGTHACVLTFSSLPSGSTTSGVHVCAPTLSALLFASANAGIPFCAPCFFPGNSVSSVQAWVLAIHSSSPVPAVVTTIPFASCFSGAISPSSSAMTFPNFLLRAPVSVITVLSFSPSIGVAPFLTTSAEIWLTSPSGGWRATTSFGVGSSACCPFSPPFCRCSCWLSSPPLRSPISSLPLQAIYARCTSCPTSPSSPSLALVPASASCLGLNRRLPFCFCAGPVPPRFVGPPHSSVLLLAPTAALASNAPSPILPLAFRTASASQAVGISRPFFLHARGDFLADATPPPISLPAYAADLANVPRPLPFPRCADADQASHTRQSVFYLIANAHQASAPRLPASHHGADAEQASAALRSTLLRAADADQASTTLRSALLRVADADQTSVTLRSALLRAADADQASATLRSALLRAADTDQASATLRSTLLRAADADQASATLRSALLRAADADQVRTRPWALHIASPLAPAAALTNDSPSLARPGCFHAAALPLAKVTTRHAFLYVADAGLASVIHHFAFPLPADADLASTTCRLAFLCTCDADLMHAAPLFAFLRPADAYLEDDLLPHAHTSCRPAFLVAQAPNSFRGCRRQALFADLTNDLLHSPHVAPPRRAPAPDPMRLVLPGDRVASPPPYVGCSRGLLHRDGAPLLPAILALPYLGDVVRRLPLLVVHQAATDRRPSWQIPIRLRLRKLIRLRIVHAVNGI
ncbi:unnamed protein product [Closterium sp. NIES-64]|nr:unnamed protein product [Closterium sp. NIES-64]